MATLEKKIEKDETAKYHKNRMVSIEADLLLAEIEAVSGNYDLPII